MKVIVIGRPANTCIESTSRFAMELGYHVTLVKDATAAFSKERMHAAHELNGPHFAHKILTTAELVAALPHECLHRDQDGPGHRAESRFLPLRIGRDDLERIHGSNVRIAVENYAEIIRFYVSEMRAAKAAMNARKLERPSFALFACFEVHAPFALALEDGASACQT